MEDNKNTSSKSATDKNSSSTGEKRASRPPQSSSNGQRRPASSSNSSSSNGQRRPASSSNSSSSNGQRRPASSSNSSSSNGQRRPASSSTSNSSNGQRRPANSSTSSSSNGQRRPANPSTSSSSNGQRRPTNSSVKNNSTSTESGIVNNRNSNSSRATSNNKKKKKSGFGSTVLYLVVILAISGILSFFVVNLSNDLLALLKDDKEITIVIDDGDGLSQIASKLDSAGVIDYASFFKFFVNISASNSTFVAGTHTLNSNYDYRAILNQLQKSTAESKANTVNVSIPEGYTIDQIAELLEEEGVCSAESFRETVENYEFNYSFLSEHKDVIYQLEGYLFPDTYNFYVGGSASSVINTMLKNFESKTAELREVVEAKGDDFHDIVTIASLVEREAAKSDEQQTISGVIHNRLNNSSSYPFLNIDATIQYVAGHRENILQADLDNDGPYNTYTNKGLVPGAIANPGYGALYAAVYPESHGYYYYVAKDDGYHVFTSSLSEHNAAVNQYQR